MYPASSRRGRRVFTATAAVLISLALAVSGTSNAAALRHTKLVKSAPAKDSTVAPPKQLQLWFNEAVPLTSTRARITPATGAAITLDAPTRDAKVADAPVVFTVPSTLANGKYTVEWATASADGHPVQGSFIFTVVKPTPLSPRP
jgi:methionine-rich copper-binding protein CopC